MARPDDSRKSRATSVQGSERAPRKPRPKYGRAVADQRVTLPPMSPHTLNTLRALISEAIAARAAMGKSKSRTVSWLVQMLRAPRAGRRGAIAGKRVLTIVDGPRGLLVRQTPDEDVYLQELEPAGELVRPVPGAYWRLHADEVAPVARALCELAGIVTTVPPYCMVAHRGIDCRSGAVTDRGANDRAAAADERSLMEDVQRIREEVFAPVATSALPSNGESGEVADA